MNKQKLPNGWKEVELEELGDINAGGTPSRPKKEYWGGKIPWLKISNLKKFYVKEYGETITEEGLKNSSAKLFPKDTILISIFASLGDVAILKIESTTNQAIAGIYNLKKYVDKVYLAYYLKSLKKHFERIGRGVAQNNINLTILRKTKISLPPLPTQKAIVSILEKAEKAKEWRKKADDLTKDFLKSVFLEMFGDPVKNPMNFPRVTIRDLVNEVKYGTSSKATDNGKYPYLRMNNLTYDGKMDFKSLKYIDLEEKDKKKYLAKKGDILFNRTNSKELVGKTAVFMEDTPMAIAGYLIRVRVNEKVTPQYIASYLNSKHGKQILENMCKNIVGMANINAQELQNISILMPPLSLQNKFASIVKEVEKLKEKQKKSREEIGNLFNALMQKAFKGELKI